MSAELLTLIPLSLPSIVAVTFGDLLFAFILLAGPIGAVCNICVRTSNGGKMPVKVKSPKEAEVVLRSGRHSCMNDNTRLTWLCDIIPGPRGWMYSVGDILLLLWLLFVITYGFVVISLVSFET